MHSRPESQISPKAERLLLALFMGVMLIQMLTQASLDAGGGELKQLVPPLVVLYVALIIYSIYTYRGAVKSIPAILLIGLFSVYPLLKNIVDVFDQMDFKRITDGFLASVYCFLPMGGLAVCVCAPRCDMEKVALRFALFGFPVAVAFYMTKHLANDPSLHTFPIMESYLIPVALFGYFAISNKLKFGALAATGLIGVLAASTWNRSFVLVSIYIAFLSILLSRGVDFRKRILLMLATALAVGAAFWAVLQLRTGNEDATTIEKFQFASLREATNKFMESGDISDLFYWEGNSRSYILVDAFYNFEPRQWFWGRGYFAVYESFVTRGVIEMGVAQSLFWWGLVYVVPLFIVMAYAGVKLYKFQTFQGALRCFLLAALCVKFLDMFILGMPTVSVYSLIFFSSVMSICLVNLRRIKRPLLSDSHLITGYSRSPSALHR